MFDYHEHNPTTVDFFKPVEDIIEIDEEISADMDIEKAKREAPFHLYTHWADELIRNYQEEKTNNTSRVNISQQIKKSNNSSILEQNWDNTEFNIQQNVLTPIRDIIINPILKCQPDIFPTYRDSIQIEYEKENGDYLEFEFFEDRILMLKIENNEEEERSILDRNELINIINTFMHES